MDERLREAVMRKVDEVARDRGPPARAARAAGPPPGADPLEYGIAVGRLYNSFRYQCRRILGRDPTDGEADEFAGILRDSAGRLAGPP